MPDELSGVNIPVPNVAGQVKDQLSLVDLANRIQAAPIDLKIKQIDAALKGNELLHIDTANEMKEVQLRSAKADEYRKQIAFSNDLLLKVREGFQQSPELGEAMLKQWAPKAIVTKPAEDGSVGISIPGASPFKIYPGGITDPKELNAVVENRTAKWGRLTEKYQILFTENQNVQSLLALGTGEADRTGIYKIAKLQDPIGSVREGDYNSVMNSPNVSVALKNMLTRAIDTEGPVFGPLGSETRKNWLKAAQTLVDTEKAVVEPQAKFFLEGGLLADRINPKKVMYPVGDITLESLMGQPAQGPAGTPLTPSPGSTPANGRSAPGPRPSPIEAGVLPTGQTPEKAPPIIPYDEKIKRDLLVRSKGRK